MTKPHFIAAAMLALPQLLHGAPTQQNKSAAKQEQKHSEDQKPGWLALPPQTSSSKMGKVVTRSAFPIGGKRHPRTEADFRQLRKRLGYDPRDLRRSFGVEKKEFLLGEPILVRFAIELAGTGKWRRDNWLYFNNRDETFLLLLRDESGKWIADRYHPMEFYRPGGIESVEKFSRKKPEIHWLPIQQYRALTKTGTYDVFCFRTGRRETKSSKSPLLETIPKDVIEQAKKLPLAEIDCTTDFTHFSIKIKHGTTAQRTEMMQRWSKAIKDVYDSQHRSRSSAIVRSWQYSLRNDFLPQLRAIYHLDSGNEKKKDRFVLMYIWEEADCWRQKLLTRKNAAKLIPSLIRDLTAKSERTRSSALFHLREWTGKTLTRDWTGHKPDRPAPTEAETLQRRWRNWWKKNEERFSSGQIKSSRASSRLPSFGTGWE